LDFDVDVRVMLAHSRSSDCVLRVGKDNFVDDINGSIY
jgi:hypothetical protein